VAQPNLDPWRLGRIWQRVGRKRARRIVSSRKHNFDMLRGSFDGGRKSHSKMIGEDLGIRMGTARGLHSEYRSFCAIVTRGAELERMLPNDRAIPAARPGKKQPALKVRAQRPKPAWWQGSIGRYLKANAVDPDRLQILFQYLTDGSEISAPFQRL